MPVKRKAPNPYGIYFITFTCYDWIPLIDIVKGYDIIYKWFDIVTNSGNFLLGYTIMPNHVHALIAFRNSGKSINGIIGNGKRFMA
jgi:REP element-mobilizing transposase RayT